MIRSSYQDNAQAWSGATYPSEQFRTDANLLDGVNLLGDHVADMVWARPAVTVLGIDCPPVDGASAVIQPEARALVSLRVPPGIDAKAAQDALIAHLTAVAPWHVHLEFAPGFIGQPFAGGVDSPAFAAMTAAMQEVDGRDVTLYGSGGSIPLCTVFQETFPEAEIMLLGVEEPQSLIHAPNESVDPTEIANMAIVEALILQKCGEGKLLIGSRGHVVPTRPHDNDSSQRS